MKTFIRKIEKVKNLMKSSAQVILNKVAQEQEEKKSKEEKKEEETDAKA